MNKKFIFITGGVVSSLGKGLAAASIATLLEKKGFSVSMLKLDPYLNVDPGTMNPFEHGEVYVTDDGLEADMDLGHYYRFSSAKISKQSTATAGQIYKTVLHQEREGAFLGKTAQVIPHISDEIKNRITASSLLTDITIVEVGGTVGDIESLPFIEAIRQYCSQLDRKDSICLHMTYVPFLKAAGEIKTKPTQHSVQTLRSLGIIPNIILCRCEQPLEDNIKSKISLFCSISSDAVFEAQDVESIYELPIVLKNQKLDKMICDLLEITDTHSDLNEWEKIIHSIKNPKQTVTIGIVGKYLKHKDAYKSVFEALNHAAIACESKLLINTIDSDEITNDNVAELLSSCDGILVPGGFGIRGWYGKIITSKYCRENNIPFFGICLGMQVLLVDIARNLLNLHDADSTEMAPNCKDPVITILESQFHINEKGGTMRLGAYDCLLTEDSSAHKAYKYNVISERHRHRYEFNNKYKSLYEENGVVFSGINEETELCEITEIKNHPWMVGVQFHPEFKSKPISPHPLFVHFIAKSIELQKKN